MAIGKKKQEIYLAAAKLFKEKGFQAASMRQLAKEVNLEPSSLYSHISSKQEILSQICLTEADKYYQELEKILDTNSDALDILRAILSFHIDMAIDDPISVTVFNDEWRHLEEPTLSKFREIRKNYETKIRNVIKQGIEEELLVDRNSFVLMQTFLSSFKWIYLLSDTGKIDKNSVKKDITDVMIRGLMKA